MRTVFHHRSTAARGPRCDATPAALTLEPYVGQPRFARSSISLFADEPLRFTDTTQPHSPPRGFTLNPTTDQPPQLKQLRLSDILESLDELNLQAIDAKPALTKFLALLSQNEASLREQKNVATRLRRAAFRAATSKRSVGPWGKREPSRPSAAARAIGKYAR